jgi:uncharacterized membrane protein
MFLADRGPNFADPTVLWVNKVLWLIMVVVELVAFVNCLTQRAEAFPVVGSVPKGGWLAMTGLALFFTFFIGLVWPLIAMVAVAVALVYLLDVRPALRDAVDGHGSW